MKDIKRMYVVIIPYLLIISLIPLSLILLPKYGYQISRYVVNKSNPQKVPYLSRDFARAFDHDENYIDLRDSFSEEFNRIVIIDLGSDNSDFKEKYHIKDDELEIALDEDTKKLLRDRVNQIDDFQIVMFLNDEELIRYQELEVSHQQYHFPIQESQEFNNVYRYTRLEKNDGTPTHFLIPYME